MRFLYESLTDATREALKGLDVSQSPGFSPLTRQLNSLQTIRLAEAARLWDSLREGRLDPFLMQQAFNPTQEYAYQELQRLAPHVFTEAMTTSDFSSLSMYVLDRVVQGRYASVEATYPLLVRIRRGIRDFRNVDIWNHDGGAGIWNKVKEREVHKQQVPDESYTSYRVYVYEKGFSLSWEAALNDLMGLFNDLPGGLVAGGRDTIEKTVTEMYCDTNGPHATHYTTGKGNVIIVNSVTNPLLTATNLEGALGNLMDLVTDDDDERPISMPDGVTLVVGSGAMYTRAMNIKNQLFSTTVDGAPSSTKMSDANRILRVNNWLSSRFNIVFNPWIRKVCGATNAAKAWWLFTGPGFVRPAMEVGFLQGFDSPQIFRKAPNTERLGGGAVPELGDFNTRANEYKGMLVFGGTWLNDKATMASSGAES